MYTDINTLDLWNQPDEGDPLHWLDKLRSQMHEQYSNPEFRRQQYFQTTSPESLNEYIKKRMEEKLAKGYQPTDLYIPEDET